RAVYATVSIWSLARSASSTRRTPSMKIRWRSLPCRTARNRFTKGFCRLVTLSTIIFMTPDNTLEEKINFAAQIVKGGGVVAYPTDTFYGLGCNPFDENAVEKIFDIK